MSLINNMMTECTLLDISRESDGEGGSKSTLSEGDTFLAAIAYNGSAEVKSAGKATAKSNYTVTAERDLHLSYHDVFRRLSDGKTFRVTSDGENMQTPNFASFQFSQVTAEEWEAV